MNTFGIRKALRATYDEALAQAELEIGLMLPCNDVVYVAGVTRAMEKLE